MFNLFRKKIKLEGHKLPRTFFGGVIVNSKIAIDHYGEKIAQVINEQLTIEELAKNGRFLVDGQSIKYKLLNDKVFVTSGGYIAGTKYPHKKEFLVELYTNGTNLELELDKIYEPFEKLFMVTSSGIDNMNNLELKLTKDYRISVKGVTEEEPSIKHPKNGYDCLYIKNFDGTLNLPKGKKSYAVSFTLQDERKTLTDKQIDKIMSKLQANFENQLGAELR